jgi:Flp pilus assembly protein TadG
MRETLPKTLALPTKTSSSPHKGWNKSRGQSLVEIAISLPLLLMLFASMVEFGFMLNYYMALIDATRYSAREYSNGDPFLTDPNTGTMDDWVFIEAANAVYTQLAPIPNSNDTSVKTQLNPATDDVIVTAYSVDGTTIQTLNLSGLDANGSYHLYGNESPSVTSSSILNSIQSTDPCEGILVVEVDFTYHQVLNLPWLAWLGSPVMHADTIMPLSAAEPGQPHVMACS